MKESVKENQERVKNPSPVKKSQGKMEKSSSKEKGKLNLYLFRGHGILWDRARDKALCRFGPDDKLVTTDVRLISILLKKGFKFKTKNPITKKVLGEAYKTFKKEIKEKENRLKDTKFDRKILNSMRISELRVLSRAKKIRVLQIPNKQEMINQLLGARR